MVYKAPDVEFRIVLLDNGSLSSESTLGARELASSLSKRIRVPVDSISVSHSHRISAENLKGEEAITWKTYLERWAKATPQALMVLPLFFGPSYGLRKARDLASRFLSCLPDRKIHWGDCLISHQESDSSIAAMMESDIIQLLNTKHESDLPKRRMVLLVDHGSPFQEVAQRRDQVARQVSDLLGKTVESVIPCSMERRPGEAYAFNEPLLKDALDALAPRCSEAMVVLSQLFLFPGRHAGPGGDIESICDDSDWVKGGGCLLKTGLLGSNPRMIDLLEQRFLELKRGLA